MHKEWLALIGRKLDEYKYSNDPNERAIYERIERVYLAPAVNEINANEQSKGRMAPSRGGRRAPDPFDGMPGVSMDDVLG